MVHPDEPDARRPRGGAVGRRVVADVERVSGKDAHGVERDVQDAWVRLGEAAALRGDDGLEEGGEAGGREPRALNAVDSVRHHAEAVLPAQRVEDRAAAGQPVAARREVVEVRLAEAGGAPGVAPDLAQQPPESLARERRLRDLAAPVGGPEVVVDPLVRGDRRRGAGEAQPREGLPERRALRLVEIEEGVIDVEENGLETVQGPTWRGR